GREDRQREGLREERVVHLAGRPRAPDEDAFEAPWAGAGRTRDRWPGELGLGPLRLLAELVFHGSRGVTSKTRQGARSSTERTVRPKGRARLPILCLRGAPSTTSSASDRTASSTIAVPASRALRTRATTLTPYLSATPSARASSRRASASSSCMWASRGSWTGSSITVT